MTAIGSHIAALVAVIGVGAGGALGVDAQRAGTPVAPTALVIDSGVGRDGRELVDERLRDVDADVRLPRTSEEARTNVRYFDSLGYRIVEAGPRTSACLLNTTPSPRDRQKSLKAWEA
jgi:hypothetical protein